MIPTRLSEEDIFQAARQIATLSGRNAYLAEACGDDPALQRRVLALLQLADKDGSFLEKPPAGLVQQGLAPTIARTVTEKPGDAIGPYKLMEQIGEGGFGLVFVAEQHHPVRRKVALKVIKPGMDTRDVVARFEAERQALAMMDHPHIAKVLDAGTTDSGRPYFVMELVRGVPITRYCDDNQLPPRERLKLAVSVCHAVQHAHQKGVIHRDLKPTNILVAPHDGVPVVKVIDFGVAKALGQQLTEKTIYTQYAQLIGTPLYMSPEQAEMNALDVDTRSDIYSLGVLLYELLTGTTPLDKQRLARAAYDEIRRLIREEEPPKPSTRVHTLGASAATVSAQRKTEPQKLKQLLRNELDWIVMKCLEKDRTRRYETASGLARDIQRYLADEPVEACPPSTLYRLQRAIRKHRTPILTTAAFVCLLAAGAILAIWQKFENAQTEAELAMSELRASQLEESRKREQAENERRIAVIERDAAREGTYVAKINLLGDAWRADRLWQVRDLLAQTRPLPGERDLRGFEWHFWQNQLHGERHALWLSMPVDGSTVQVLSPDGRFVARNPPAFGRIMVHETASGREVFSRPTTQRFACTAIAFSGDGSRMAWVERQQRFAAEIARQSLAMRLRVADLRSGDIVLAEDDLQGTSHAAFVYLDREGRRAALVPHAVEGDTPGVHSRVGLSVFDVDSHKVVFRQSAEDDSNFLEGNLTGQRHIPLAGRG